MGKSESAGFSKVKIIGGTAISEINAFYKSDGLRQTYKKPISSIIW